MVAVQRAVDGDERSVVTRGAEQDLFPEVADDDEVVVEPDDGENVEYRREQRIGRRTLVEPPHQYVDVGTAAEIGVAGSTASHVLERYRLESTAHLPPLPQELLVPVAPDSNSSFAAYADPARLVSTEWLSAHLGHPEMKVVESDEDVLLYDVGHIPGAVKIDWHLDLNDPVTRDYIDGEQFAALMDRKGIRRTDTVVIYGDKSNWWAAYALWVFTLFGHEDVRLLDGGRDAWISENRDTTLEIPSATTSGYPVVERNDTPIRAFKDDVLSHLGRVPLVDVRSPQEYTGERTHMPDYPEEGALRGGHIPTAVSIPWAKAAAPDGRFRSRAELDEIYSGVDKDADVIAYCRIGERSSHTWFVLTHLLGYPHVRNYDGSWTEWGNAVRVPIVQGDEPGTAPVA